jgi:uncharacterized BrkB/YihY/UPF0761 family membrane protein
MRAKSAVLCKGYITDEKETMSPNLPKKVQTTIVVTVCCAIAALGLLFLATAGWLVLGLTGLIAPTRAIDPRNVLIIFGISLAMMCGILWVAYIADVIKLSPSVEKRIWRTLIAGILTAVAGAIAAIIKRS